MDHGRDNVRRRLLGKLQDVFAEIGLDDLHAGRFERVVQRALLADHRFRFDRFFDVVAARELAHDAIHVGGRLRPVHDRAARRRVFLELLEIDIEVVERAVANRRGVRAQRLDIVEFRHAIGAPLDEIALQLLQRGLQLHVGELGADARFEMHGGDLHGGW